MIYRRRDRRLHDIELGGVIAYAQIRTRHHLGVPGATAVG